MKIKQISMKHETLVSPNSEEICVRELNCVFYFDIIFHAIYPSKSELKSKLIRGYIDLSCKCLCHGQITL